MVGEAATEDSAEGAEELVAEEETAPVRTMTTPCMPSEAEVERHRLAGAAALNDVGRQRLV